MIREHIAPALDHDPHFRWRGEAVTRIENLSDIVFALAMGMIVLSSDIPKTFEELQVYLLTFIPAFLSFTLLLQIWNAHFTFFRRYGVADTRVIFYNVLLLFFVLYSAYPLKFAFEGFFSFVYGYFDNWERARAMGIDFPQSGLIGFYFSAGYAAINFSLYLMYRHALNKAKTLELSPSELTITKGAMATFLFLTVLCIITGLLCRFTPAYGFAGWLLILNWPFASWVKRKYNPEIITNEAQTEPN
ncbi:MAG: TMEM175 family protein [Alphaproteobacteria bacterium]